MRIDNEIVFQPLNYVSLGAEFRLDLAGSRALSVASLRLSRQDALVLDFHSRT